ncbi:MAG: hypothetical protein J6J60_00770 [Clostridia bacterium]|nr:hypothetical protein [Clostridia bacterium]
MQDKEFSKWLGNYIKKNNVNKQETFKVQRDGKTYCLKIQDVMDCIKLVDSKEQNEIKKMLEKLMGNKNNIKDYFMYLAVGIAYTFEECDLDENEEAM